VKIKVNIVIPSRTQEKQIEFIKRAILSIRNQSVAEYFDLQFLIGVDRGQRIDTAPFGPNVDCVESDGASQAKALNAAIQKANSGFIAFLEDDDQWERDFLKYAFKVVQNSDFVSSTQYEVDENDQLLRINDFPTPSGWFMPIATMNQVGLFDETFKLHLDNDWLGRLSKLKLKRMHLIEATAPVRINNVRQTRPQLFNVVKHHPETSGLARHGSPYPLVRRLVHSKSGMYMIATNQDFRKRSSDEFSRLNDLYKYIPW
jgi:glycosyltransferase involved in cell wall biosynthesis